MDLKVVRLFSQWPELSQARNASTNKALYIYHKTLTIIVNRDSGKPGISFFCYSGDDIYLGNYYFPIWRPELEREIKHTWNSMQSSALSCLESNKQLMKDILLEFCDIDIVEDANS